MPLLRAHHIYLMAPGASPDDVRRFYMQGLGLPACPKPDSLAHVPVLWFTAGPIVVHVGYPPEGIVGGGHTALATDDQTALRQRLTALGYTINDDVIPMGYPRFYAHDPWGNQFEILPAGLPAPPAGQQETE